MATLFRFVRWVLQKVATGGLIVVLGLCACGLWLFLRDKGDFDLSRNQLIMALTGKRQEIRAALDDVHKRMDGTTAEMDAQESRARQAEKIIATLDDLQNVWDRFIGNPEQQRANADQIKRMQETRDAARSKVADLKQALTRLTWERDGLELALGKLDGQLAFAERNKSIVWHYLTQAWQRLRWWVLSVLALYFFGPTAGKIAMFYGVAPFIVRGRPVRLAAAAAEMPEVETSHVSLETVLQPGDRLWIRERFLQSSDEGLDRRTRFVLDWHIPFTCVASGLVELIEMRNAQAETDFRVTLSNHSNPHVELALVTVPQGGSIVLRPSFLAGVVATGGRSLVIRRRWQLFRWQSWVTLQFRFFEFTGPCRLIVAGSRGVRAERLEERATNTRPARRTNQDATIGFTPNLDYRPVRAETFWSYYRGMNPLFDDLFAGRGIFLCQEISTPGDASGARRFWSGVWSGLLKVFGL
jgi:hypothetical protein